MESTRVVVTDRGGVPIVALEGEHDVYDAGALRRLLDEDLADPSRIVVDLSRTAFVDSTVVAVILSAHRRRRPDGGVSVVLGDGVLRRMFEIMRLDQVFDTYPTAQAALAAARSGRSTTVLQRRYPPQR
jgi:anti-sigma B factor antagonist